VVDWGFFGRGGTDCRVGRWWRMFTCRVDDPVAAIRRLGGATPYVSGCDDGTIGRGERIKRSPSIYESVEEPSGGRVNGTALKSNFESLAGDKKCLR